MGKIAVQLKLHGESEIAQLSEIVWVSVHACNFSLGNIQFEYFLVGGYAIL